MKSGLKLTVVGFKITAMNRFHFPPSSGFQGRICSGVLTCIISSVVAHSCTPKNLEIPERAGSDLGPYTRLLAESSFSENFHFMLPVRHTVAETLLQMAPLASSGFLPYIWQPYLESLFSAPQTSSLHCLTGSRGSFGWNRRNDTSH